MPRTSFTTGAHRDDNLVDRFDQLKLETGEHARIWVPSEDAAWMELVHSIRAPVFGEDGKPVMTVKKGRPAYETDFIGRPICLGDPDAIKADEMDPEACPVCAGVKRMLDAGLTDARELLAGWRYALPVISYDLGNKKNADGRLRNPPNGRVLVWAMSPWTYRKLDDTRGRTADLLVVKGGAEKVKLQMSDLMIHCENGSFQKLDQVWPLRAAWSYEGDVGLRIKAMLQELWTTPENRPTDDQLRAACGREPNKDWMFKDIEDAEYRWGKAVNGTSQVGSGASSGGQSLAEATEALLMDGPPADDGLMAERPGGTAEFASPERKAELAAAGGSLFDDAPPPAAPPAAAPVSAPAGDGDLFGGTPAAAPPAATPAPASPPAGDGLFGDTPPPAPNGSAPRATQSFEQLIEAAAS